MHWVLTADEEIPSGCVASKTRRQTHERRDSYKENQLTPSFRTQKARGHNSDGSIRCYRQHRERTDPQGSTEQAPWTQNHFSFSQRKFLRRCLRCDLK